MDVLDGVGVVCAAGAVGGLTAYLSTGGLRRKLKVDEGPSEHGFFSAMLLGAVAAAVSWGLGASVSQLSLTAKLGTSQEPTVADLVAAVGVGLAGSKWLMQRYQVQFYQFSGSKAAASEPSQDVALDIANGQRKSVATSLGLIK